MEAIRAALEAAEPMVGEFGSLNDLLFMLWEETFGKVADFRSGNIYDITAVCILLHTVA